MDINPQKIRNVKNEKRNIFFRKFNVKQEKVLNKAHLLTENISDSELIDSINNAKKEWLEATQNFEYVDNKEIIDYYTYKILACQIRYEYFLKLAKEKGYRGDFVLEGHQ